MEIKKIIKPIIILAFVITIFTSVPLFINYLKGTSEPIKLFVDLHIWFGLVCIIFIVYRIRTKKFMKVY